MLLFFMGVNPWALHGCKFSFVLCLVMQVSVLILLLQGEVENVIICSQM